MTPCCDQSCCDESPLGLKRSAASTSCGCACACCLLIAAMLLPFATGLWICIPCGWPVQPSPPPPLPAAAPHEGVGVIIKASEALSPAALLVSVLAINSALGFVVGYCLFCALGDVGGTCAIRGSEKRLCWWLALSLCGGFIGLVCCSCCVWPSPWAIHEVHVGAPRSYGQHHKHHGARPNAARDVRHGSRATSGHV